ncbi:hypothetical protein, partial [Bradyrhizobium sp.]|uniref:hypothetical protein n=1 Tax=Bradyrhizobium sp. TaxID=376 RepID=UPI003C3FD958
LYNLLPPEARQHLDSPDQIKVDVFTRMLAEVPGGLEQLIADIHAHPLGYDRVQDKQLYSRFRDLLERGGATTRILYELIPQYCGTPHYSTATPVPATMKGSHVLDGNLAEFILDLYYKGSPELAAKVDASLTGPNFSDVVTTGHVSHTNPIEYIVGRMLQYPGLFPAIGEITGIKEMVTQQLGQKWGWDARHDKFRQLLVHANQTGQIIVLHNDWGDHGKSAAGRPSAAVTNYENLPLLMNRFSGDEFRQVQIVFAHTGLGRLVRPDAQMSEKTHVIKHWEWDPETGRGWNDPSKDKEVTVNAPEHIHKLYELFEAVPNARVDISWNDVTQAYMQMMHSHPEAAQAVVDFFIHHQDRILFGSDTVKPVNEAHYNQGLMTGSPLFTEIALQDPDAAFKILRGNYDEALKLAYKRSDEWTEKALKERSDPDALAKVAEMKQRRSTLDAHHNRMGREARQRFDAWVAQVERQSTVWDDGLLDNARQELNANLASAREKLAAKVGSGAPSDQEQADFAAWERELKDFDIWQATVRGKPTPWSTDVQKALAAKEFGIFQQIANQHSGPWHLERQTGPIASDPVSRMLQALEMNDLGLRTGPGTSGGDNNADSKLEKRAVLAYVGILAAVAGAATGVSAGLGHAMSPSAGGGYTPGVHGSTFADLGNNVAFGSRFAGNVGRSAYLQKMRLQWEPIFEEGFATRDLLDRYVSRMLNAAPYIGITSRQRAHIAGMTEQLWKDITFLRAKPLDPASGWTEKQRYLAISAKIGEYQISVSREGNLQDSSLNAADPRRQQGQWLRGVQVTTYGFNLAVAAHGIASDSGLLSQGHAGNLALAQAAVQMSLNVLFAAGNTGLLGHTGISAGGGLAGVTKIENNKFMQILQAASNTLLTGGGAALSANEWMTLAHALQNNAGTLSEAWPAFLGAVWALWARRMGQITAQRWRVTFNKRMPSSIDQER